MDGSYSVIRFHCNNCGQKIRVPEVHAGKKGQCPKCKNIVVVPRAEGAKPDAGQIGAGTSEAETKDSILDPRIFDIPPKDEAAYQLAGQKNEPDKTLDELQKLQGGVEAAEPEPVPQRKLPWLIDIFLYPSNKAGLMMLGIFVGVLLLMEVFVRFLNFVTVLFAPFYLFFVFFLVINLIINITISLYRYWYLSECIRSSADGQIRAAETIATTPGLGELLWQWTKIVGCFVIVFGPVIYYVLRPILPYLPALLGAPYMWPAVLFTLPNPEELIRNEAVFYSLFGVSAFFFPMCLLAVCLFDSFRGLNPIRVIRSILSTLIPYCGLILLLCVLLVPIVSMRKFVIIRIFSTRPGLSLYLPRAVINYLMLVGAHLLGRFAWKYKEKLNWEV